MTSPLVIRMMSSAVLSVILHARQAIGDGATGPRDGLLVCVEAVSCGLIGTFVHPSNQDRHVVVRTFRENVVQQGLR